MASRKEQKEAARQRRLAEEQAAAQRAQKTRRLQVLGGVLVAAIVVVVVLVVISVSGGKGHKVAGVKDTAATTSAAQQVSTLLQGIPQRDTTLGNPKAKVTITEYGDLECPICQEFSEGAEESLINNEVRSGQVKLVYKSFETASSEPDAAKGAFNLQQTAAYAAGAQNKAWNFILLFYRRQQTENTPYVTTAFLTGLAKAIPGLDVTRWNGDRFNPRYASDVIAENKTASSMPFQNGQSGPPAILASSAAKQTEAISGDISYAQVQKLIKQVS